MVESGKEKKKKPSGDEVSKILSDLNTVLEGQSLPPEDKEREKVKEAPPSSTCQESSESPLQKGGGQARQNQEIPSPAGQSRSTPTLEAGEPAPPPVPSSPAPAQPLPVAQSGAPAPSAAGEQFPVCYLYPRGQEPALLQFQKNLMEAVRKNTKTPLELVSRFQTAYAPGFQVDLSTAAGNAKGTGAACALILLPTGPEATPVRHAAETAFSHESLPVLFVNMEEIQKRLIYVDLAIEIFLHRRKKQ